ncbi:MAG: NmrA/HSCARG family protein [Acidimicrobiia bacterium]
MSRILVIGATGQQGGHVINALVPAGHQLVALVRDPSSDSAQRLSNRGIELTKGSLDSVDDIAASMNGVDAVFAMTTLMAGLDVEVVHGMNIAEAAERAGVPFLVYSSVASADQDTGIGHFDSKWEIEQRLAQSEVPTAVVAPAFFMDNYVFPWNLGDLAAGKLREAVAADTSLQMVDARDIGTTVAEMIANPGRYAGSRVEIAGDDLIGHDIVAALSSSIGTDIAYEVQPLDEVAMMGEDMRRMYEWFNETGYSVDIEALRADMPNVHFHTLKEWSADQPWDALLS